MMTGEPLADLLHARAGVGPGEVGEFRVSVTEADGDTPVHSPQRIENSGVDLVSDHWISLVGVSL